MDIFLIATTGFMAINQGTLFIIKAFILIKSYNLPIQTTFELHCTLNSD